MATALITGPTAGIGRAFADKLAVEGYDLVLVARDEARLKELATELTRLHGVACEVLAADLTEPSELALVEKRFADGPIEVLVNNAGFGQKKPFWANPVEVEEKQFDLLVRVVLRLTHAAILPMIERGSGAVINVSSVAGFFQRGSYSAHKAWVTSFSAGLAIELHSKGVAVMALCPGFVHTEFHDGWAWTNPSSRPSCGSTRPIVDAAWSDLMAGKAISIPNLALQIPRQPSAATPPAPSSPASPPLGLDGRRRG